MFLDEIKSEILKIEDCHIRMECIGMPDSHGYIPPESPLFRELPRIMQLSMKWLDDAQTYQTLAKSCLNSKERASLFATTKSLYAKSLALKEIIDMMIGENDFLCILQIELDNVSEIIEPNEVMLSSDYNIGHLSNDHSRVKKLYTLRANRIISMNKMASVLAKDGYKKSSGLLEKIKTEIEKDRLLNKIFWISIQDITDSWMVSDIAIREKWQIVGMRT